MKTRFSSLLALFLLAGCASAPAPKPVAPAPLPAHPATAAPAQTVAPAPTLAAGIDAYLAQPQFMRADWGIAVRSLDTGRVLYQHNADRLFVPASNAKLFTTALALAKLGGATRIATTLYATSTHVDAKGTLRGDLILYGRGDPSLGLKDISPDWADRFAAALAQRGVKRVVGDLIADATYFSGAPIGSGWEADDLQAGYGAVPSALVVQGNLIRVDAARDARRCCTIAVTPGAANVQVINQTGDPTAAPFGLYRPAGSSTLYALGQLPARTRQHTYVLAMPDPALAAGNLLRDALARQGIQLAGRVRALHWPQSDPALTQPGTQAIARIDSPTIAELVDHTLKHSDNLFAQSLLLQTGVLAAQRHDCDLPRSPDSSAGWGLCALRGLLAQAGIPPSAVLLDEGSGLARRDLVTPNALVQWLTWATTQPWGPNLRNALPVAGVDGTLQYRFRDGTATGNLQAKTGTLSHVYTLTGFVTDAAGEHLVFSIMLNRYPRREIEREGLAAPPPQQALDDIARMLADHGAR
ncbi:MAG: D-alanyl-D-alanine carboxypeptidase [Rhodanobacteraceae bacterium]|jgi:D-alanyl-D-alanine carboxypeptidase/D-alanyl-D-alanine-endopeptidase (penicillin-binding protein 4)|nr:MAG: D-alanyl-D-alanine carboxypeptidase [Rhodanobacteraceae bacterium]